MCAIFSMAELSSFFQFVQDRLFCFFSFFYSFGFDGRRVYELVQKTRSERVVVQLPFQVACVPYFENLFGAKVGGKSHVMCDTKAGDFQRLYQSQIHSSEYAPQLSHLSRALFSSANSHAFSSLSAASTITCMSGGSLSFIALSNHPHSQYAANFPQTSGQRSGRFWQVENSFAQLWI